MMILNWRYKFMTFLKFYDNGEEVLLNATAIDKIIINEVEARPNNGEPSTEYGIVTHGVRVPELLFCSPNPDRTEEVFADIQNQIADGATLITIPEE